MGARINDINLESLIREERGNDAFPFPWSNKPLTDLLRPITTSREGRENDAFRFPRSKKPLMDFLRPLLLKLYYNSIQTFFLQVIPGLSRFQFGSIPAHPDKCYGKLCLLPLKLHRKAQCTYPLTHAGGVSG